MSQTLTAAPTATSSSNFRLIYTNALKAYERRTKKDLLTHPLAARLEACDSPSSILVVLQQQVQELDMSQSSDNRLTKLLDPTVNVLSTLSDTLGEGVSLVFSPAKLIFTGVGVLLSAAKDVRAGQDALVDIFERMESFFRRLEIYTSVPPNEEMVETITTIMVEVLGILAIATKEITQGRTKKYLKKLVGRTEIEDALKRLDKLTQEEARMASAQVLKVTHSVDERVRAVDDKVAAVIDDGIEARVVMQQTASDVDQVKRNQLRYDFRKWLSPPDPSTNHNIACGAHHKGTATWFFQGGIYNEWKSTPSLLWIHGKPGSGKSILCSTIIEDIQVMCDAGQASMAYFYFDFRDINKQHWRDLVTSLLIQLSARSGPRCDILSRFYAKHECGAQQPSDDTLIQRLKEMLALPNQLPIYLIMDALDECSNISGIPSPRDKVLRLVKGLADLNLPKLHICVTSRPEVDIRDVLEPLTSRRVSLHDQTGQQKDIEDYVRSVVYSDLEPIMRRWRKEDKELVIETLSNKADGMFRWVFCQLESLRHCLPPSVRRTLSELPESLDETYERILKEIKKPNRAHALRVLQSLVVAIRPLRVAELAEVLAVDFDDAEGIPKLNANWRWEDQEQALMIACSSLIAVVEAGDSRVVQFSHFSVKEYLTSPRLAIASGEAPEYHVDLKPAHTTLSQACLGVLLRTQYDVDGHTPKDHPLAEYAAQHWTTHAQFEDVSSHLKKGMEYLFDQHKPHFVVWRRLYDIDTEPTYFRLLARVGSSFKFPAAPLYYAALCGFRDLVQHLIIKYSQDVNTNGGYYFRPIVAALAEKHFQTADVLRQNGADPHIPCPMRTPLHSAAYYGDLEVVQKLIEYGADISAVDGQKNTPLYIASDGLCLKDRSVLLLLLEHGADVDARAYDGSTPLHNASTFGSWEVVRLLLGHGADINARGDDGSTPLHKALYSACSGGFEVARLLLERGADVNARAYDGSTPLHNASKCEAPEVARLLLERGADVNAPAKDGWTPLHNASYFGALEVVRLLLERGADVNARADDGSTPLYNVSEPEALEVARLLLERGADVNARAKDGSTPLYNAPALAAFEAVPLLLERGADVNARAEDGSTPLHNASYFGALEAAPPLLECGADVNARAKDGSTPLHIQVGSEEFGVLEVVRLLLDRGADVNARADDGSTPLHWYNVSQFEGLEVVRLLLDRGADVNARADNGSTPLHWHIPKFEAVEVIRLLLERGADVNVRTKDGSTPLHIISEREAPEVVRLLLDRGADVNARGMDGSTPLHISSESEAPEVARLLLERGADVNARADDGSTPLFKASSKASYYGSREVVRLLLERGADVNAREKDGSTPLHNASDYGAQDVVFLLLERGADLNARADDGSTPLHNASRSASYFGAQVVRLLLDCGAEVKVEENRGRTALQVAEEGGKVEVMKLLLEYEAK